MCNGSVIKPSIAYGKVIKKMESSSLQICITGTGDLLRIPQPEQFQFFSDSIQSFLCLNNSSF